MNNNNNNKKQWQILIPIGFIICLIFFVYFYNTFLKQNNFINLHKSNIKLQNTNTSLFSNNVQTKKGYPVRLKITKIGVDASIEYVGLNSIGEMDVPKDEQNVAWYSPGTNPGTEGSAVIAGHLDRKTGEAAVFANLDKLKIGDQLLIEDINSQTTTFVVSEISIIDSNADASNIFLSTSGAHLNLITCTGKWDNIKNQYSKRLVIFADIIK